MPSGRLATLPGGAAYHVVWSIAHPRSYRRATDTGPADGTTHHTEYRTMITGNRTAESTPDTSGWLYQVAIAVGLMIGGLVLLVWLGSR